jgi:redox-sensitive bicupin YhaK (pirin superfamily)
MIEVRRAKERGRSRLDWLDSRHTFSFAEYYDRDHTGFRDLRVINEDRVAPGRGFATHSHRDMEIVSYVLDGALAHRDSLGTGSTIRPGEVQRMTAGTGVTHSELNPSKNDSVHFLQIWILPERAGLDPSYEQRAFADDEKRGRLRLVASHDGREGSVTVHQDVEMYVTMLDAGGQVDHPLAPGRGAWVQVVRGEVTLNGTHSLAAGDGAALDDEALVEITASTPSEVLLFDLA